MPTKLQLARDADDYALAATYARQLIDQDPGSVRWRVLYADSQFQQGCLDEAEQALLIAQRCKGSTRWAVHVHLLLGQVLNKQGRHASAVEAFKAAAGYADRPEMQALAWLFVGHSHMQSGEWAEGEAYLRKAIELNPAFDEAMYNLALCCHERNQTAEGITWLRRALTIDPDYALVMSSLGQYLSRDPATREEAEGLLRRSLELKPENKHAYFLLSRLLKRQGRLAESLLVWDQAMRALPDWPQPLVQQCAIHLAREDLCRAEESMSQAVLCYGNMALQEIVNVVKGLPGSEQNAIEQLCAVALRLDMEGATRHELLVIRGRALFDLDRLPEATSLAEEVLRADPKHASALCLLGEIVAPSEPERAVGLFERAIAVDPASGRACRELGATLFQLCRFPDAEQRLRTALTLNDRDAPAWLWLGEVRFQQADEHEAESCWLRALELKPKMWQANQNLGVLYASQGEHEKAEEQYRRAVDVDPEEASTLVDLGMYLVEQGRITEACAYLKRALLLDPEIDEAEEIRRILSTHNM